MAFTTDLQAHEHQFVPMSSTCSANSRHPDARRNAGRRTVPVGGSAGVAVAAVLLSGCGGMQSTLVPAGRGAEQILQLFWWMLGGAIAVWVVVIGLAIYAIRVRPVSHPRSRVTFLIIGGGAVIPTVVLAVYLVFGLGMLPGLIAPAPDGSLTIAVSGEQWWWRVRYAGAEGDSVGIDLANEVRMPVGEPVQFYVDSPDVIHSFWIPSLGGKMDMMPGRVNRLRLEPTRTGVFRGVCAEFCGASHAFMAFYAVVMERDAFDAWLAHQASPAQEPTDPVAIRGRDVFLEYGCGACHAIRGTEADGAVGPDLTHVGGRLSLGAGMLQNERDDFLRWISETAAVKPDVHMPSFGMLPQADLQALAAYLDGLE